VLLRALLTTFAAGLTAAVIAAPSAAQGPLTPRAFLPMVATGGDAPATPTAPSTAGVTVRGLAASSVAANGGVGELRAYGEIVNGTAATIGEVVVEVTVTAPGGKVLGHERGTSRLEAVAPGGVSPFGVLFEGVVNPGSVTVTAQVISVAAPALDLAPGLVVTAQPPSNVVLSEDGGTTTSATQLSVAGVVRNAGATRLEVAQVVIAIHDAAGNVVFAGFTNTFSMPFLDDDDAPVLGPGQSGSFQVLVPRGPIMAAGPGLTVQAWVEGRPAR